MFDLPNARSVKSAARATLPQYDTTWQPPKDFPNLSAAKAIAIDTETKDLELKSAGPGWARGVGHIVGVSIATEDRGWYFPIRHEVQTEHNMNPAHVLSFLKDNLGDSRPKVFANAFYDLGWLTQEGVKVGGVPYDVIIAERLLDNTKFKYSLESVANQWLGEGKVSNELYEWCARAYGGKANGDQRANIYRTPPSLVGPYAESDATLPFQILKKQWANLKATNLMEAFDLESRLTPLLVAMRMRGVRVSEEKAYIARQQLLTEISAYQSKLNELAGFVVNVNGRHDLQKLFDKLKVQYPLTAAGNPSFVASWLEGETHPSTFYIRNIRKLQKVVDTFINSAILDKQINGQVYTQFNQMGATTGRFSSSTPNLQNIPKRDKKLGPIMRSMFIPDEGKSWIKMDHQAIEFRLFVQFVQDELLLNAYKTNPHTDFHQVVVDFVGGDLPRTAYKTISFSRMFGGGRNTITQQMHLNFTEQERIDLIKQFNVPKIFTNTAEQLALLIMARYDDKFPAVNNALKAASELAQQTGEMRTLSGRRIQYHLWEPNRGARKTPVPYEIAVSKWGRNNIKRAKTYKALNAYTQGGGADVLKKGMVDCWEAGLFDADKCGVPHLTVHDELDNSYHPDLHEYFKEVKNIMELAYSDRLDVPLIVEVEIGEDWGQVQEVVW